MQDVSTRALQISFSDISSILLIRCITLSPSAMVFLQAMDVNDYNSDELVTEFNVQIDKKMARVQGRVLEPPSVSFVKSYSSCFTVFVSMTPTGNIVKNWFW